jgi:hypothetical protein
MTRSGLVGQLGACANDRLLQAAITNAVMAVRLENLNVAMVVSVSCS